MQSRMDRYNTTEQNYKSRTQRNSTIYDAVKKNMITDFDLNSNVSIITNDTDDIIDVDNVKKYLDNRYREDSPKRKSIELPKLEQEETDLAQEDTKEYDINAIIEKAKKGKNIDYTKERLKKVRETQFEILNNLDLENKKETDYNNQQRKLEEENLKNLINTITQLELCNRNSEKEFTQKEIKDNLDLLSDLKETKTITKVELEKENNMPDQIETRVLSKVDEEDYQNEFADISHSDKGTLVIKIIIFIVILVLIFGAIYIVNNILDLNLF